MFIVTYQIEGILYNTIAFAHRWIAELLAEDLILEGVKAIVQKLPEANDDPKQS